MLGLELLIVGCASKPNASSVNSSTPDRGVTLVGIWVSNEIDLTDDSVLWAIVPRHFSIEPGDLGSIAFTFFDATPGNVNGKMEFFDLDKRLIGDIGVSTPTLTEDTGELDLLGDLSPTGEGYPVSYVINGNVLTISYVGAFRKQ
jgi:hypothetical protein